MEESVFSVKKSRCVDPERERFAQYILQLGNGNLKKHYFNVVELPEDTFHPYFSVLIYLKNFLKVALHLKIMVKLKNVLFRGSSKQE